MSKPHVHKKKIKNKNPDKPEKSVCYGLKTEINKLEAAVKALKKAADEAAQTEADALKAGEEEAAGGSAAKAPAPIGWFEEDLPPIGPLVVAEEPKAPSSGPNFDFADCEATSSKGRPLTQDDKLRRLVAELNQDIARANPDVELCVRKMDRVGKMWNECMVDEMRNALTGYRMRDKSGIVVQTLSPEEINEKNVVAEMDGTDIPEFTLAEFHRKPEQPKGCSRTVWMEHLKMGKKFADCIAHLVAVNQMGDVEKLDWTATEAALSAVETWEDKFGSKRYPLMPAVQHMVAYEIIRRVQDFEYFNCTFCNVVEFNVRQFLSHYASGTHCKKARQILEMDGKVIGFGFASKHLMNMTMICEELHGYYSRMFTTPLVKTGAKVPQPGSNSIPTEDYIKELEEKYGKAINGDLDTNRLDDAKYVASQLPGVIQRHKSPIGRQLFTELDEYFDKGVRIYCRRCHWKVSNKASFYRHVLNPYHVSINYLPDGKQFHLITVSINIHLRDDFVI